MAKSSKDKQKIEELTADLKRVQADFINFKQRADEERLRYTRFGRESAVMALLPLIDNIERALGHTPKELNDHEWANGVRSVAKQAADVLKGLGVEKIGSKGQEFNPDLHEAVHMDESRGKKELVTEELQPGYTMDGEVIRHAMVKVGRK
ncbi:MAG TPA: nucleotide exchange factor GrpE [Candidatus Saccharimonadales bacterium]|jgi:molecular chaperone GrpE